MNIRRPTFGIWKTIRKPLVWRALFVLSVFSFNLLMGHSQGTIAMWTFFSVILAICIGNTSGEGYVRRKNFLEEAADRRKMNYGSRSNFSFYDRDRMFGR